MLYVIGEGHLDCHRANSKDEEPKFLKTYEPGEAFGELALLYNAPRAATITTKDNATLYSLDRETFNAIVKDIASKKRETYELALKKVKILDSISAYERSQVADAVKVVSFKAGDTIIKEGDVGDVFYMIIEGTARTTKGGAEGIKYQEGDYFGERALLKNEPRAATIEVTSESA